MNYNHNWPQFSTFDPAEREYGAKSLKQVGDLQQRMYTAVFLFTFHIGFMLLEYGGVRKKNADSVLLRYVLVLSVSTLCVFLIGFNLSYSFALATTSFIKDEFLRNHPNNTMTYEE